MKVLTSPDGSTILTLTAFTTGISLDGTKFIGLDGKNYDTGTVAERPDHAVKMAVTAATKAPYFEFMEAKDFMRDLRYVNKVCADAEVGTEGVTVVHKGATMRLVLPLGAKPDYTKGLAVGVKVAVGPNVSPKALMNAHGEVVAITGDKVTVRLNAGDLDRIKRATGKNYAQDTRFHVGTLEVIA